LLHGLGGLSAALGPVGAAAGEAGKQLFAVAKQAVEFGYALATAVVTVPRAVERFVKVFDPAAVQQFEAALDSVNATIGQAFLPVTRAATRALRTIADVIAPALERLAGPVEALSDAFVSYLIPAARNAFAVIEFLVDVLGRLTGDFRGLGRLVGALTEYFGVALAATRALFDTLAAGFGGTAGFFDQLAQATRDLTRTFVRALATLAKALGMAGFLERFRRNLAAREGGKAKLPAPSDFAITDVASALRERALAAARASVAQGGGGVKGQVELLSDLVDDVDDIIRNGITVVNLDSIAASLKSLSDRFEALAAAVNRVLQLLPKPPSAPTIFKGAAEKVGEKLDELRNRLGF
jgi:hypothetical protein